MTTSPKSLPAALLAVLLAACSTSPPPLGQAATVADTIYVNGDIVTMAGDVPQYVEAVAVKDGRIVHAGSAAEARGMQRSATTVVDLAGGTLLPGFIDGHGHAGLAIEFQRYAWLRTPQIASIADVQNALREHARKIGAKPGDWIIGNGYDPSLLKEKRHPTADELDAVAQDNPVLVIHASGHAGVANHALLKLARIDASTPDPEGGAIGRVAGSREPNGLLEEAPHIAVMRTMPPISAEDAPRYVKSGTDAMAAAGLTTVQEAYAGHAQLELLVNAARQRQLPIDVAVFTVDFLGDQLTRVAANLASVPIQEMVGGEPVSEGMERAMLTAKDYSVGYNNRLRLAGVKFFGDGSPTAGTGFLAQPYTARFPGKPADYRGISTLTDAQMETLVDRWYPTRFQMQVHLNGDGAIEQFLDVVERATRKHGLQDKRPVAIHSAMASDAQIARMKRLGVVPSFYASMVSVGAAVYEANIGERAQRMQPAGTAQRLGMIYTIHNDAPLVPWDILPLVDAAVNRRNDMNGKVYGTDQRLSPYAALLATTRHAAWQLFEERTKGTLEAGKLADLVILDRNPLKVDPATIKGIRVVETIKEGRTVYRAGT